MANNLHEQETALYKGRRNSGIMTKTNANNIILQQTMGVDKSVFLLGGFALENAIKAFLVCENSNWISGGQLYKSLKSHKLTALQKLSKEIPHPKAHTRVLEEFESGLDSWFRYPCALTIQATIDERHLYQDRIRRSGATTTRQLRDRLKGHPQERQHSAANGGTRDRVPPARCTP